MHFFTQSLSSFRSTCPHHRSLFCCNTSAMSSISSLSLSSVLGNLSFSLKLTETTVKSHSNRHIHTHTHPFNGPFSGTTQVSQYQKGGNNLDFTEARDSEWQWHQLGQMQVCTVLQTDNHASTPPLSFLQTGYSSCRPTNSVKALKAKDIQCTTKIY